MSRLLEILFRRHRGSPRGRAVLRYPADRFGSLGDQAMFIVALQTLKSRDFPRIDLMSAQQPNRERLPVFADRLQNPADWFDGSLAARCRFLTKLRECEAFYFMGADVLDGYYSPVESLRSISLIALAAALGLRTTVLGFSFNASPAPAAVAALAALPREVVLNCRDPESHARVEAAIGRPARLVADSAFLLEPDASGPAASAALAWIAERRARGDRVIGINLNEIVTRGALSDPLQISVSMASEIVTLFRESENLSFMFIAHDLRGNYSDQLLNRVANLLACERDRRLEEHCFTVNTTCSAREVKAICGELDLVVSCRMHLAIASLGMGTPVLCIEYQDKCRGMLQHFGLPQYALELAVAFGEQGIATHVRALLAGEGARRAAILKRLPEVQSLARRNFEADAARA